MGIRNIINIIKTCGASVYNYKFILILSIVIYVPSIAIAGNKTFTEKDFYWDDQTSPHKQTIIAGVNKVHRENKRCAQIDPGSAYISSSKGTKNDPVFFVTCGKGNGVFNVFFSKSEVEKDKKLSAVSHIDRATAIKICEKYVKQNATHPSTVDYSKLIDMKVNNFPNGNTRVETTFTAKNSFNLELEHKVECLFNASGFIEGIITEIDS